jgi:hypothetical protein
MPLKQRTPASSAEATVSSPPSIRIVRFVITRLPRAGLQHSHWAPSTARLSRSFLTESRCPAEHWRQAIGCAACPERTSACRRRAVIGHAKKRVPGEPEPPPSQPWRHHKRRSRRRTQFRPHPQLDRGSLAHFGPGLVFVSSRHIRAEPVALNSTRSSKLGTRRVTVYRPR